MYYFDYNSSTPMIEPAKHAITEALNCYGNPASIHSEGQTARRLLEKSRTIIAEYFKLNDQQIIFNSGATEANNQIIKGFKGNVWLSASEHASVFEPALTKFKAPDDFSNDKFVSASENLKILPINSFGVLDLEFLKSLLHPNLEPTLLLVQAVNSETGVIQPLSEIVELIKQFPQIHLHVDAAQAIGRLTLPYNQFHSFCFSAGKFGGAKGSGALIINQTINLENLIDGGGQERGLRSGSPNVLGITAMATALKHQHLAWGAATSFQNTIEQNLKNISSSVKIFGVNDTNNRIFNTTLFAFENITSQQLLMNLDLQGFCLSSGSACSAGIVSPSKTLKAMKVDEKFIKNALRISTGWLTTEAEVEVLIKTIAKFVKH